MKVKLSYSKTQLEEAVKFIARNNQHFLGQKDYIKESIMNDMREIARDLGRWMSGTMGYNLIANRSVEGIDSDDNTVIIDILVDPALRISSSDQEYLSEMVEASEENIED